MTEPMPPLRATPIALLLAVVAFVAACGGDDSDADVATPDDTTSDTTSTSPDDDDTGDEAGDEPAGGSATGVDGGVGDFTPGPTTFRVVNLSEQAVDIYGFTSQGLVEEYEIELGVEPGTVTEYLAPPEEGKLVIFEPGATDVTGFHNPDNLAEFSTVQTQYGPVRTVVLSTDVDTGELDTFELWEQHDGSSPNANALEPAAADGRGTVLMMAVPIGGDSFRPSAPGTTECLAPRDPQQASNFAGGTTILVLDVEPGTATFDLHSFDAADYECEDAPALSDVTVEVGAGERVLAIVHETDGGPEVVTLPLAGA